MRNLGVARYHESEKEDMRSKPSEDEVVKRCGRLHILDDLIRLRAQDVVQEPILAYPKQLSNGQMVYEYFTGEELDCMVDEGVCNLLDLGIELPQADGGVIALFTPSDMNMIVAFFALTRLGYTILLLSPRLHTQACLSLLDTVNCTTILHGSTQSIQSTISSLLSSKPSLTTYPIPTCPSKSASLNGPRILKLNQTRNREAMRSRIAIIAHSSGSTGLPKPVTLNHKYVTTHPARGPGLTSFNTLPWYHMHGLTTALQAMYQRKTAYLWDVTVPLTTPAVVAALREARAESVHCVPYLLQLLVDSREGLDLLRAAELVTYGGASCPDDLGDRLVAEGVKFGGYFGSTETGLVAESVSRPLVSDPYWNYLSFFPSVREYMLMSPVEGGKDLFEAVYLAGYPPLTTSNSDNPPGSYHSSDVFAPHPTLPHRWKYVSRLDDRVNLLNGEKVLPLPIEGTIKQHPLVEEAVVVGIGRAVPGLLLFRAPDGESLSEEDFLERVWPAIEEANSRSEQFAQIAKDMVVVLPAGAVRPQTDKGSTIRAQTYRYYDDVIDGIYREDKGNASQHSLQLDQDGTEAQLMKLCEEIRLPIPSPEIEFFAAGVDSLKAIHLRRLILREFSIPEPKDLGQNVVFETGCVRALAGRIVALQNGTQVQGKDDIEVMKELVSKYSTLRIHGLDSRLKYWTRPRFPNGRPGRGVILTGATGSLGVHILHQLLNDETVSVIYCLTRRDDPQRAILQTLHQKSLPATPAQTSKIIALKAPLHEFDMGISPSTIEEMKHSVSLIIHTAWPVNFTLPLHTFEPHIAGLSHLLDFSMSVYASQPAVTLFCSSVSTAFAAKHHSVPEEPLDLSSSLKMGYAQSKLVGEHIITNARKSGARAYSLRIGQVSGHSSNGLWNDTEAVPLMLRSAVPMKCLPDLKGEECSWFPADLMARCVLELGDVCSQSSLGGGGWFGKGKESATESVYNLVNPNTFTWSALLETLRGSGFEFETVPFEVWLQRLKESERRGEEDTNPAIKLVAHYAETYGADAPVAKTFTTEKAENDSGTLKSGKGLDLVRDGVLERYALDWKKRWLGNK
ncbi:putative NRPS-like enzyme [Aspergillus unguis]